MTVPPLSSNLHGHILVRKPACLQACLATNVILAVQQVPMQMQQARRIDCASRAESMHLMQPEVRVHDLNTAKVVLPISKAIP